MPFLAKIDPSLPRLKEVFQGASEENAVDQLYFMGPKKPWQPRPPVMNPGMPQDPSHYFNNFNMGPQSIPFSPVWSQYQYSP